MAELKEGDQAPNFESIDQDGNTVKLSDFSGKKIILYFYPKDDTPGCTKEACNLRDNMDNLEQKGFVVLGVSGDDEQSHQRFIKKYDLPFTLLADTDKAIHEKYNTWVEKNMYGRKYMGTARHTYVIGKDGRISKIFKKVDTSNHTEQILKALA